MKKIPIILILTVLLFNFFSISYALYLNFTQYQFDILSTLLYLVILSSIIFLINLIIKKNAKAPIFLSYYFVLCLITTMAEITYLSYQEIGTSNNMIYFLIYFSLFIYVTKSISLKKYFSTKNN